MVMQTALHLDQVARWPTQGKHILAAYDNDTVVVYQAYCPSIGHWAAKHNTFGGGGFSFGRMSWIKTNFLWMMYRSNWGRKHDQEVTLAVRLKRSGFDAILAAAVPSTHSPSTYASVGEWKQAVADRDVRLQWDPDHDPWGAPLTRRAVQLGMRGACLERYARDWIVSIEDISDFVAREREKLQPGNDHTSLLTPLERPYMVDDADVSLRLGLSECVPVSNG